MLAVKFFYSTYPRVIKTQMIEKKFKQRHLETRK